MKYINSIALFLMLTSSLTKPTIEIGFATAGAVSAVGSGICLCTIFRESFMPRLIRCCVVQDNHDFVLDPVENQPPHNDQNQILPPPPHYIQMSVRQEFHAPAEERAH